MRRLIILATIIATFTVIFVSQTTKPVFAATEGEGCNSDNDCNEGNNCGNNDIGCFCSSGGTCQVKGAVDEVCGGNSQCQPGLECVENSCTQREVGEIGGSDLGGSCAQDSECSAGVCRGFGTCACRSGTCDLTTRAAGPEGAAICSCARADVEEGTCADIGTRLAGLGFRCTRDAEDATTCVCQNTNYQQGQAACVNTSPQLTCIWNSGRETQPSPIPRLVNPLGVGITFQHLIGRVIKAVLGISGSLALAVFVWGGFMWLTSGGSPDKIEKGKKMLVWAVMGLALIFGAYAITDFIIKAVTGATGT